MVVDSSAAATRLDPDVDPQYPDVDAAHLSEQELALPEARALSILRCRLADCTLEVDASAPVEIQDSVLTGIDLTGRRITNLTRVRLERCRLGGADLGDATVRDVVFHDCILDLSAWRGAQLLRVTVTGGRVDGTDLSGARLSDVALSEVVLTDLTLDRIRAERVDLTGADLTPVRDVASLGGCTISSAQAVLLAVRSANALGLRVCAQD